MNQRRYANEHCSTYPSEHSVHNKPNCRAYVSYILRFDDKTRLSANLLSSGSYPTVYVHQTVLNQALDVGLPSTLSSGLVRIRCSDRPPQIWWRVCCGRARRRVSLASTWRGRRLSPYEGSRIHSLQRRSANRNDDTLGTHCRCELCQCQWVSETSSSRGTNSMLQIHKTITPVVEF